MSDNHDDGEKKQSFWTTLPGILTGFAALISSVTALVTVLPDEWTMFSRGTPKPSATKLPETIYSSCKELLEDPIATTGTYLMAPEGVDPDDKFEVFCDMETEGGGWTLLAKSNIRSSDPLGHRFPKDERVDIYQNFSMKSAQSTIAKSSDTAFPYSDFKDEGFFANIQALGEMPFSQILLFDGKDYITQSVSPAFKGVVSTSLRRILDTEKGLQKLHQGELENSGLILMLGATKKEGGPCFYPDITSDSCEHYYEGDATEETTAFYVGSLAVCSNKESVRRSLWGGRDCYEGEDNSSGGFGGFTIYRPSNPRGWIEPGYRGGSGESCTPDGNDCTWEIYLR